MSKFNTLVDQIIILNEESEGMKRAIEADAYETDIFKKAGEAYEAAPEVFDSVYKQGPDAFRRFLSFLQEVTKFKQGTYL